MNRTNPSRREFLALAGQGALALPCLAVLGADVLGTDSPSAPTTQPDADVHPAMHWKPLAEERVRCTLCPRQCTVADMERGYCGVRENRGGRYYTLVYARPCALHVDPIEKKPLFHFLPGTKAFSIATAGCNLKCRFCQNWRISQSRPEQVESVHVSPARTVAYARRTGSRSIAYTYSEPTIFYEYMHDTAKIGRTKGVHSVMISNGYMQPDAMKQLAEHLSAVKVDLKAFTEKFYREVCSGHLKPVLATLKLLKKLGMWTEIVVLVVPTLNDAPKEIAEMCDWVASELGPDVPLHFTRFHPTYKIRNLPPTPVRTLERCRRTGLDKGLRYVYAGNVPGHPGENTYCPKCGKPVITRLGFRIAEMNLTDGTCAACGTPIAGVWK